MSYDVIAFLVALFLLVGLNLATLHLLREAMLHISALKIQGASVDPTPKETPEAEPIPGEILTLIQKMPPDDRGSISRWVRDARRKGRSWPEIQQRLAGNA